LKVYTDISQIEKIENAVITVGTFDGLHIGHQKVISEVVKSAKSINGQSVIITFFPHPRKVVQPDFNLKLIISRKEKMLLFEKLGVDHLFCIQFTKDFAATTSEEFIKRYLVAPFRPTKIVIGYDHHFGKDRKGDIGFLKEMGTKYGFEVEKVDMQDVDNKAVSSSKIREAIAAGDMKTASKFLGYHFSITGRVVKGNQLGRTIGFPTANIEPDESDKIIPAYGVYAVLIKWKDKTLKGMSNIGVRPTLKVHNLTIEAHIFDFSQEIYGEEITIVFIEHTRDEKKFRDLELLRRRLIIDRIKVKNILDEKIPTDTFHGDSSVHN
jgi:riboflavin kinase / FMN adenylyltransferase